MVDSLFSRVLQVLAHICFEKKKKKKVEKQSRGKLQGCPDIFGRISHFFLVTLTSGLVRVGYAVMLYCGCSLNIWLTLAK